MSSKFDSHNSNERAQNEVFRAPEVVQPAKTNIRWDKVYATLRQLMSNTLQMYVFTVTGSETIELYFICRIVRYFSTFSVCG